jgi:hypothetical protein
VPVAIAANGGEAVVAERGDITEDFFATLGIAMRTGRGFTAADTATSRVAVVNETLARRLYEGRSAVGSRVWVAGAAYDVIGVVADYASHPLRSEMPTPRVFMPLGADSRDTKRMSFVIRAAGEPSGLVQIVRTEIRKAETGTLSVSVETVDQVLDIMGQEMMVATAPLLPLVTIGMLLTTAGIYGVLAFAIARRSRELAVRVAVGASAGDVVGLVARQTLRLIAAGSGLGTLLMFGLARVVRAGGGAGSIWDPSIQSFLVPLAAVAIVAAIATWVPARRALDIDPVVLLRTP